MMLTPEQAILLQYSTPGLRRQELDRFAKKDHLGSLGIKGEEAAKILDQMYPPPPEEGPETCPR